MPSSAAQALAIMEPPTLADLTVWNKAFPVPVDLMMVPFLSVTIS
jgi:hypothetical protein